MELEHLKIETRLTIEKFASEMGEYVTESAQREVIDVPSRLRLIRKASAWQEYFLILISASKRTPRGESGSPMTPSLIPLTELLRMQKSGQFPDETVRIEV